MKNLRVLALIVLAIACFIPLSAGAYSVDFTSVVVGTEFYSPYYNDAGFSTETFNDGYSGLTWTWSGNGQIKTGSDSTGAAPAGYNGVADPTPYAAVPYVDTDPRTAEAVLPGTFNYFGLWWGSADWAAYGYIYNELRFYSGGFAPENLVATVGGNIVNNPANGSWTDANVNTYVNIYGLPNFDRIQMYSSTYAFEADNMTVGVVPEPTTMLLLGLGLVGLAGARRFKQ